ncbi:hypothetical protein A2U01_0060116, partial [Trifolium medium]|nr:hypothetical protein [Trifolium medium]
MTATKPATTSAATNGQYTVPQPPEVVIKHRNNSEIFPEQAALSHKLPEQSHHVPEPVAVIKSTRGNTPNADRPQLQVEEVVTF